MGSRPDQLPTNARRIPTWGLVIAPVLAAVISNADVVILALAGPHTSEGGVTTMLATTIPLSAATSGLTLWFLLRLRHEVDRRAEAEREVRSALAGLGHALDRERMLHRELDHRVRNNLSALLGMVSMYEGTQAPLADVVTSLSGKIITLRESYNLIAATHGEGIELIDLLRAIITALLDDRSGAVTLDGPSVRLTSREANAYAMIVQELLTNAAKHGALRGDGGTIRVSWSSAVRDNQAHVALRWIEHPVAADATPFDEGRQGGMGLTLIQGLAESDLRGNVSFAKQDDRWIVDLVANLKVPALPAAGARPHTEARA